MPELVWRVPVAEITPPQLLFKLIVRIYWLDREHTVRMIGSEQANGLVRELDRRLERRWRESCVRSRRPDYPLRQECR
jgi:hypothetical protein